jgi:hypothetical protein
VKNGVERWGTVKNGVERWGTVRDGISIQLFFIFLFLFLCHKTIFKNYQKEKRKMRKRIQIFFQVKK